MKNKIFYSIIFLLIFPLNVFGFNDIRSENFLFRSGEAYCLIGDKIKKKDIFNEIAKEAEIVIDYPVDLGEELYSGYAINCSLEELFKRILYQNYVVIYQDDVIQRVVVYKNNQIKVRVKKTCKEGGGVESSSLEDKKIAKMIITVKEAGLRISDFKLREVIKKSDFYKVAIRRVNKEFENNNIRQEDFADFKKAITNKYFKDLRNVLDEQEFKTLFGEKVK